LETTCSRDLVLPCSDGGDEVKIGLISDVHANISALQAVINDMPSVDLWICAGDGGGVLLRY